MLSKCVRGVFIALCLAVMLAGAKPALALSGHTGGLNRHLIAMLVSVERHFHSSVTVTSGCRSRAGNARAGGAHESWHLRCAAADFRVAGVLERSVLNYARGLPGRGGVGCYCRNTIIHLDTGPHRDWYYACGGHHRGKHMTRGHRHHAHKHHRGKWHGHGHHHHSHRHHHRRHR